MMVTPVKSHQNLGNGRKGLKDKALGTGVSSKNAHILDVKLIFNAKISRSTAVQNLETKRIRIESNFPSPSDYGKSIQPMEGVCDHRFFSDLHVGLQVQAS